MTPMYQRKQTAQLIERSIIRYSLPLTKLAAETEFSQQEKVCRGSTSHCHGLKLEQHSI